MSSFGAAGSWLTAFVLCWVALRLLMLPRAQRWFLDLPNHRSLHANPIPRVGGIAMIPAALVRSHSGPGYSEIVLVAAR
jgi:UDP-N-acetylmuramyl pentapeptide phosphotransferase/UDP-N-acetylglucosamine-1-phosphate transferase